MLQNDNKSNYMIDLNKLQYLCISIETGNLSLAAKKLDISKSALSRSLDQLEIKTGCQLLERSHSGVKATPDGLEIYHSLKNALDSLTSSYSVVEKALKNDKIKLKVGITDYIYTHYVTLEFIDEFLKNHPNISFYFHFTNYSKQDSELFDISFSISHKDIQHKLFYVNKSLYASNDYLEEFGEPQTPLDLVEHRVLHMQTALSQDHWTMFDGSEWVNLKITKSIIANHPKMLKDLMIKGNGVASLPDSMIEPGENIREILSQYPIKPNFFGYRLTSNKNQAYYCQQFIDQLICYFQKNDFPPIIG
ncbi:LysR family transcriptional regulator [Vibrio inusitatus NBRC 102082]|uniref:LysR family transcriptional regulator n=1 Tax=Vibrio inusitatus NBRC 102082 TaxID=1219070 RepID=A0A4Y3HYL4_9VIBR|nr:LysR family transcriptional regulator [Vibrio inusitatus]GEA52273.1 LysR family transcriptional regulator [Vibrio inusitatus NBRC 102082]